MKNKVFITENRNEVVEFIVKDVNKTTKKLLNEGRFIIIVEDAETSRNLKDAIGLDLIVEKDIRFYDINNISESVVGCDIAKVIFVHQFTKTMDYKRSELFTNLLSRLFRVKNSEFVQIFERLCQ